MRPDPGLALQEATLASMTTMERTTRMSELRANGRWLVWRQVDAAGIDDPIEVAEFVLGRLYPEAPAGWFAEIVKQLREARAAGTWNGFSRPDTEQP